MLILKFNLVFFYSSNRLTYKMVIYESGSYAAYTPFYKLKLIRVFCYGIAFKND